MSDKDLLNNLKDQLTKDKGLSDSSMILICDKIIILCVENLEEDIAFYTKLLSQYMEIRRRYVHSKFHEVEEKDNSQTLFGR